MSVGNFHRMNLVRDADLPARVKLFLYALITFAGSTTGKCWPSVKRLTRSMGVATNTTTRAAITEAEKLGVVSVIRSSGYTRQSSREQVTHVYTINDAVLMEMGSTNRPMGSADGPMDGVNGCREWGQPLTEMGSADDPEPISEPISEPKHTEPPAKPSESLIESVWKECRWKPVGKNAAWKAISKAIGNVARSKGVPFEDAANYLAERAAAYTRSAEGQRDRQYRPHPSTWFNQGRYDDDPAEWNSSSTSTQTSTSGPKSTGTPVRRTSVVIGAQ